MQAKFWKFILTILMVVITILFPWSKISAVAPESSVSGGDFGFNLRGLQNDSPGNIKNILSYLEQCKTSKVNELRVWADGDPAKIKEILKDAPPDMKFILTLTDYYGIPTDPTSFYQQSVNPRSSEYQRVKNTVDQITSDLSLSSHVSMWEIMNEPNCSGTDACVAAQHQYLSTMSDLIYQADPNHLISAGLQGQNTGGENFANGDYQAITNLPHITANSCHLYPGDSVSVANCQTALQITKASGKYFYVGEAGLTGPGNKSCSSPGATNACSDSELQARATKMLDLKNQFTQAGADGFFLWQFNPSASSISRPDDYSIYPGDPLCGGPNDLKYVPLPMKDKDYYKKGNGSGTAPLVHYPDESEEPCVYNEGALNQQDPNKPYTYRPPNGAPSRPEMRGDAGLNFNVGVKGTHCGQNKSTPINLEEVAPYNLIQTPLCKEVHWAGEIQMNYKAPPDIDFRVPFAQEIADKLAGTWDPEHVNENQMDSTERAARGLSPWAGTATTGNGSQGGKEPRFVVPADVSKDPQYNLSVRGQPRQVDELKGLVNYGYEQPPDPEAPQLDGILGTDPTRPGAFVGTYRVQDPGGGDSPPWKTSLLGLSSSAGETVNTPGGGHDIGGGKTYMVVYADQNSITLVNGTADDPVNLYAVQMEGVSVNHALLAEYNQADAGGRTGLPQLSGGQALGTAAGGEVKVAVRDSGQFMDPRSKLDWWQKYAGAPSRTEQPFTNTGVTHLGGPSTAVQSAARDEIERKTGFLKKVLAPDIQDKLKCDFINYVRKQGSGSMYANFKVDGTSLASIPCSPRAPRMASQSGTDYDIWFARWGRTWKRLALFPNERATGTLSFLVCDDRKYYINQAFPEVMRMGLAANTMFQLFTPKISQDMFYRQPNYGDLRDPLNSQKLIGDSGGGAALSFVPQFKAKAAAAKPPLIAAEAEGVFDKIRQAVSGALTGLASRFPPGAKLLAQDTGTGSGNVVSQYPCGPLLCTIDVVNPDPNNFVYELVIQRTANSPQGTLGDLQINPPADWEAGMRASGQGVGPHIQSMTGTELRFLSTYGGAETFMPRVHSADELANFTFTISGDRLPEGYKFHDVTVQYKGGTGGTGQAQPQPCDPASGDCLQCKETATCSYNDPTARAQIGPSDTEIWQYYKNHELLGVDWGHPDTPQWVKLDWKIPAWHAGQRSSRGHPQSECTIEVPSNEKDRQACSGPGDDAACGAPSEACNEIKGFCGTIMCTKVHERVVDVYNSVPFLASAWQQLAGISAYSSGVFNTWKTELNPSITGSSQILGKGCSDKPAVVFDQYGNFVPNPGASQMYFSWDQHFGFPGEWSSFADFGKSEVTVTMTRPQDNKAKILFYRIGGLCNALTWLSSNYLLPLGVKNPAVLATAGASAGAPLPSAVSGPATGTGFSGLTPAPATTPAPLPTNTIQSVPPAQVNNVVNQVAATVPTLPKTETPVVSTVINAGNLTNQLAFASVQNGDQILVYPTSQQVYVYRPATKQIIAQMPTINFSVRNGGASGLGYETFINNLKQLIPNAVILDRNDAQRKDYAHSFIVDVSGTNQAGALNLALLLKIKVDKLPTGEPKPQQSAYLIIVGADEVNQ